METFARRQAIPCRRLSGVYDLAVDGWKLLQTVPAGPDHTTGVAVSPNGEHVLIAGPHSAKLLRVKDGSVIKTFGTGWISGIGFLTDDVLLVRDQTALAFWNTQGARFCEDKKIKSGVMTIVSGSGMLAVGTTHQRDAEVWSSGAIAKSCRNAP
jgi:hypothetical protein